MRMRSGSDGLQLKLAKSASAVRLGDDKAVWISARAAVSPLQLGVVSNAYIGITNTPANAAPVDEALIVIGQPEVTTQNARLRCARGGTITQTAKDAPVEANRWYDLDLVVLGGLWAAAWFDGDGPYVVDSNVSHGSSAGLTVAMAVAGEGITDLFVDYLKVRTIDAAGTGVPVVNPATLIESLQAEEQLPEPADD